MSKSGFGPTGLAQGLQLRLRMNVDLSPGFLQFQGCILLYFLPCTTNTYRICTCVWCLDYIRFNFKYHDHDIQLSGNNNKCCEYKDTVYMHMHNRFELWMHMDK